MKLNLNLDDILRDRLKNSKSIYTDEYFRCILVMLNAQRETQTEKLNSLLERKVISDNIKKDIRKYKYKGRELKKQIDYVELILSHF